MTEDTKKPKPVSKQSKVTKATKKTASKRPVVNSPPKADTKANTPTKKVQANQKPKPKVVNNKITENKQTMSTSSKTNDIAAPVVIKSGSGVALTSLLLSLGALGLSGYMYYLGQQNTAGNNIEAAVGVAEVKKDVQRLDGSLNKLETSVDDVKAGLIKLQSSDSPMVTVASFDQMLNQKLQPLKADQAAMRTSFQEVQSLSVGQDKTYEISKSRQLLDSAQYQIEHQRDVDGAIKLLRLANKEIQALDMPSLANTRAKILAHINSLETIDTPDLVSVSSKLDAISADVSNWPLLNEPKVEIVEKTQEKVEDQPKKGFLGEVKAVAREAFNESFKVQKVGAKPRVLLAPQERYFLDQNLRLQLLTAQNAALQGRQSIFVQNLSSSKKWIAEYFDENDARVSDGIQDIAALEKIKLQPNLPDISDAISTFNRATQSASKVHLNTAER